MWGPLAAMVDSGSDHTDLGVVPRVFQNLFTRIQSVREFVACLMVHIFFVSCQLDVALSWCRGKRALLRSRSAINAGVHSLRCVVIHCSLCSPPIWVLGWFTEMNLYAFLALMVAGT
jgi:hypothetical protein